MVLDLAAVLGAPVCEDSKQRDFVLLEEGNHPVVENIEVLPFLWTDFRVI